MPDTVQISSRAVSYLIAGALNHLWHMTSCCPQCCAQCFALKELLDDGQLDTLYGVYMQACDGDHETWDGERVNRAWLEQAWSKTECHEGGETDET